MKEKVSRERLYALYMHADPHTCTKVHTGSKVCGGIARTICISYTVCAVSIVFQYMRSCMALARPSMASQVGLPICFVPLTKYLNHECRRRQALSSCSSVVLMNGVHLVSSLMRKCCVLQHMFHETSSGPHETHFLLL